MIAASRRPTHKTDQQWTRPYRPAIRGVAVDAADKDTEDEAERTPQDGQPAPKRRRKSRVKGTEAPRDVDGKCSRCGRPWPCLHCLTSTPPFVRVHNNF
ncbi:MAG: hypothetical protein GEV10_11940 [Streptosporangiales bacterium]|nr:hypothetical protein [Streptosporangiales bacterium]